MTITEWLFGLSLGIAGGVIVCLIVLLYAAHRQTGYWMMQAFRYRDQFQDAEDKAMIQKQEYDTLIFLRDQTEKEDLTPAEIEYLHRTLGLNPPA